MSKKQLQAPRGTHDILPEEAPAWRRVESAFRAVCARYNYGEIRTPIFESTELFARSAGESSDLVVTKQMYTFTAPDGDSYTMRPEGTAGVVRAYVQHHLNERGPVCKLAYVNSHFRYEAPQAGRYRQHHQCGIEMFGADAPESDAEVLSFADDFLSSLGLKATVKINSLGTPQSRAGFVAELRKYLHPREGELSEDSRKRLEMNPLRIFDSKDERDHQVLAGAPRLLDSLKEHDEESTAHFARVLELLDGFGIAYEVDTNLVRGLDYYSRTAFEFTVEGFGSSIGGGGRYNGLVEELGGPPTPAIGFGMGVERVLLALGEEKPQPEPLTAFLVMLGDDARRAGPSVLRRLRQAGVNADCDYAGRSMKAQMREANRQQARFALIVGESEIAEGTLAVKDMALSQQASLTFDEAVAKLQQAQHTS
jgi:histidyl-tRNA synthetase